MVPGYVKCPKCHAALPRTKTRDNNAQAGGTAMQTTASVPWIPIVITVVVAGGIIAFFGLRKGSSAKAPPVATDPNTPTAPTPTPVAPNAPAPTTDPVTFSTPSPQNTGPGPNEVARDLRRALEQRRLWSTVSVGGGTIEVRGTSCADKAMGPTIDSIAATARAAGLTKLRCVEQSGGVVFARDL